MSTRESDARTVTVIAFLSWLTVKIQEGARVSEGLRGRTSRLTIEKTYVYVWENLKGSSTMRPLNPDSAQRRSDSSEIKQALGIQIRLKPIGWQHTRRLTAEVMPGVGVLSLPLCKKVQQCSDSKDDRCPMSKRCADRSTNPNEQAAWTRPGLAGDGFANGLGRGEISKRIRAALAVEWQRDAGSP